MKKQVLSLLLVAGLVLTSSLSLLAQDNEAFDNGFSLKLLYTSGNAGFSNMTDYNINNGPGLIDPTWVKNNPGFGLKIGSMFFLNGIKIHEKMRIGLDATYMGFNYISSEMRVGPNQTFNMHNVYFNPEFGPSFSFSPADKMSIDVAFKASLVIDVNFGSYSYDVGNTNFSDTYVGVGIGFRYGPAIYYRYKPFLVGIQYNMGNVKQNIASENSVSSFENKTQFGTTDFIIGFKF
ncbi:MAG: hypothetical protein ACPGEG_01855 [Salibacteraceae bacterium]